jgi:hypothetical protein
MNVDGMWITWFEPVDEPVDKNVDEKPCCFVSGCG